MIISAFVTTRNGEGAGGRFPGKGMASLCGRPLSYWIFKKCAETPGLDSFVACIPDTPQSKPIGDLCTRMGGLVAKGPLEDLLTRWERAIELTNPDWVLGLSGDSPFVDQALLNNSVKTIRETKPTTISFGYDISESDVEGTGVSCHRPIRYKLLRKWYEEGNFDPEMLSHAQHLARGHEAELTTCVLPRPDWFYIPKTETPMKLSIDLPLELAVANKICAYLGHFPKSSEEVYLASKHIFSL